MRRAFYGIKVQLAQDADAVPSQNAVSEGTQSMAFPVVLSVSSSSHQPHYNMYMPPYEGESDVGDQQSSSSNLDMASFNYADTDQDTSGLVSNAAHVSLTIEGSSLPPTA